MVSHCSSRLSTFCVIDNCTKGVCLRESIRSIKDEPKERGAIRGVLKAIGMRLFAVIAAAPVLQLNAWTTTHHPTQLPTSGRVYFIQSGEGGVSLSPAPGVLVLVERMDVCDSKRVIPLQAFTTGIDAFLVRSDANGNFSVPPRSFKLCTRASFIPSAFVPGYRSWHAYLIFNGYSSSESSLMKDKRVFAGINENDVVLEPQKLSEERAMDLVRSLHSSFSNHTVTVSMSQEILREMKPEMSQLAAAYPTVWRKECENLIPSACNFNQAQ
jgi:hypothetical protein